MFQRCTSASSTVNLNVLIKFVNNDFVKPSSKYVSPGGLPLSSAVRNYCLPQGKLEADMGSR